MLPEIRTIKATLYFSGMCQSVQIPRQSEHSLAVTRGLEQLAGHQLCDRFNLPGGKEREVFRRTEGRGIQVESDCRLRGFT